MYIPSYNPVPPQVTALHRFLAPGNNVPQGQSLIDQQQAAYLAQQQSPNNFGQDQGQYNPGVTAAQQSVTQSGLGAYPATGGGQNYVSPQVLALAANGGSNGLYNPNTAQAQMGAGVAQPVQAQPLQSDPRQPPQPRLGVPNYGGFAQPFAMRSRMAMP